jgi:hypothetical protein
MITGFGLFSGVEFNISGVVVESMAREAFWPAAVDLAAPVGEPPAAAAVGAGRLTERDGGARVWQRALRIDGEEYEVAFLLLDVLWDLAPALVLHEAETFRPDLLLLTGRGGDALVFEGGSVNKAIPHPGFASDGAPDRRNLPRSTTLLPPDLPGVRADIRATWDGPRLAAAARAFVDAIDPRIEVRAPAGGREENAYICNNLAGVVLHALGGVEVPLAGGAIRLRSTLRDAKAGFLHYPASAGNGPAEVRGWTRVLARVVAAHFAPSDARESAAAGDAGR